MTPLFRIGRPDPAGRALVLVHGAGGHHGLWGPVLQALKARGVPAVAVDLPGHGRSPGPAGASVEEMADTLLEDLQGTGIPSFALAGHSLGGAVGLVLAARGAPGLAGLAAVSTGARLAVNRAIIEGLETRFEATVEMIARYCFPKGTPESVWRAAADTMAAVGPEVLAAEFRACDRYGVDEAALAGIGIPVEVVCGTADVMTPLSLSEDLARLIPGAHLTRLEGVGHMSLLEAPEPLAEALARLWKRAFPE